MRNRLENKNTIVGLIIIFALLFFCVGVSIWQLSLPVLTLKVDDVTIRQDEELPDMSVYAKFSGDTKTRLDADEEFCVQDLMSEIENGKHYVIENFETGNEEGIYQIKLDFTNAIKRKLITSWNSKIRFKIEPGNITILNKFGDWEKERFRFLDGTYAAGWVNMEEKTYFFDESGNRVKGKQFIDNNTYFFKKDGLFDDKKNPVNPNRPMIALTFDDGPGPYTMQILEALDKYDSKASFFLVGRNVYQYPDEIKKMFAMGCDVGNHSTNHVDLSKQTVEGIYAEIQTTNDRVLEVAGQGPTLLRPPYGNQNANVREQAGMPLIMWSMDPRDWESKNVDLVRDYVLSNVKDGDIILLHDIHESTLYATLQLIPLLIERGYQLVTVREMAQVKGITLENGKMYRFMP